MPTILDTLNVQMCTISYGKEASFAGKLANVTITVTPMAAGIGPIRLNWSATGDIFSPFSDTTSGDTGAPGIIALPRTDQDGFRHGTTPFKNWYYKAAVVATLADGQQLARSYQFQTTSSTLDLDLLDEDSVVTALPVIVGPGTEPAGLSDATRTSLAATYLTQVASDGSADQTVRMNTALAASSSFGVRRTVTFVGDFTISAPLIVPSNTTVDFRAATITAAGSTFEMLLNQNYAGTGGARDSNITLLGGRWVCGAASGNTHRVNLRHVDNPTVDGLTFNSASGKYCVLLADVTAFRVRNIYVETANSDGIHVTGPASNGLIENVAGKCGDDLVALGCSDYLTYDYSRGNITDVTIRSLRGVNMTAGRGVLLFTVGDASITDTLVMSNITVQDVKGKLGAAAVYVADDIANNGSKNNIRIDDISAVVPSGYGIVDLASAGPIKGLVISNVRIPAGANDDTTAVKVTRAIDRATITGITTAVTSTAVAQTAIGVQANANGLVVADVSMPFVGNNFCRVVRVYNNAALTELLLSNASISGNTEAIRIDSGSTLARLFLTSVGLTAGGSLIRHRAASAVDITATGVSVDGTFLGFDTAGGSATVRASAYKQVSGAALYRSAAQAVTSKALGWPVDLALLGRSAGDMAYNTNAALACGIGPVVSDGISWKNLFSGATY